MFVLSDYTTAAQQIGTMATYDGLRGDGWFQRKHLKV
jgi:hypothetical protein